MKLLQMLYWLSKTPTRNTNYQLEVLYFFTPKSQLATTPETTKESFPLLKVKSPRKHLTPILKKELDLKPTEMMQFFRDGALKALDKYSLKHRLYNLRDMGFEDEEIKSEMTLLLIPINEVMLRRDILQECGISKVTTILLNRFEAVIRRRIGLLKVCGLIPADLNVSENILSSVGTDIPPPDLRPLRRARYLSPNDTADALPLGDLHKYLVLHYIAFYLENPSILKKRRLFKRNSLRNVLEAFDEFQKLNVTKKQLHMCLKLSHCDTRNLEDLQRSFPYIGGESIKKMIQKHPKIALCTPSDVRAVLTCLQKYGFTEKTIVAHPPILTVNVNVLQQGLDLLQSLPDLWALRHSDGILRLLYQKHLISKLQYFKSLPQKVIPTVTLLTSGNAAINRALQRNTARTPIADFLKFLSVELHTDVPNIKSILSRHPHWRQGSASEMLETLSLLRAYGFKDEHILENLHILLYSRSYVAGVLEKNLYPLSPGGACPRVPDKTGLSLCLYYIEKEHHFTGMGITQGPDAIGKEKIRSSERYKGTTCRQDCLTNPLCRLRIQTNRCEERERKKEQAV